MFNSNRMLGALRNVNFHRWFVTTPSSAMVRPLVTAVRPTISTVAPVMVPHQRSFASPFAFPVGSSSASIVNSPMTMFRRLMSNGERAMDSGNEVEGLPYAQTIGFRRGLRREQVVGLKDWQVWALCDLQSRGLTVEHLRGCDWFNSAMHKRALVSLMEKGMNAEQAMAELAGLAGVGIEGIVRGLRRGQVVGLKDWQVWALCDLQSRGLTAEHLRDRDWFSYEHGEALVYLMERKGMSATDAMAELDGLTRLEARGINLGLRRKQVVGITWAEIEGMSLGLRRDQVVGLNTVVKFGL